MNKRERVMAALAGRPVDYPPLSFWGHDFLREWSAEELAAAMLDSVHTYDYDYLKVNPRATYYAEAWGARYIRPHDATRGPETERWVLHGLADVHELRPVDGRDGPFAEQLGALRLIGEGLDGNVPFLQTVFSPLSVFSRLANGSDTVLAWMEEAPELIEGALGVIAQTLAQYARACLEAGTDGIFFATTEWGTRDALSDEQYARFGRPYDLGVLEAAAGAPFNVLHVCRPNNMLEALLDYPVAAFHWADRAPGNPSLGAIKEKTDRAVMGGVDERDALMAATPDEVRAQIADAMRQTSGERLLIAPGCSISPQTPPANIRAAVEAARS